MPKPHPLHETAKLLPKQPGIYMFRDLGGNILYVGKAKSLRNRVLQYFDIQRLDPAKREMIPRLQSVDTIITSNEVEALALEASLIQEHRPPFNVRLVDDSSYLYIKMTAEDYPKVELTRTVLPDGAWYRGPYPNARAVRHTLKEARKVFPWCAYPNPGARHTKACFAYHLGLCPGICIGAISLQEYQQNIERLKRFLDGDTDDVLQSLRERMEQWSKEQAYERAADLRDRIRAIERTMTPQYAVTPRRESIDVMSLARRGTHGCVAVMQIRKGRIMNTQAFSMLHPSDTPSLEIIRGFVLQYYRMPHGPIQELIVSDMPLPDVVQWIQSRLEKHVRVTPAQRGWKKRLLDLTHVNALEALKRADTELTSPVHVHAALEELARVLSLSQPPKRIEAYDISNIQGTLATASMIVFEDGAPKPSAYRKFRIISKTTPDDFAMMREALTRRFARHAKETEKEKESAWPLPDLVIIDGGKGQLNSAVSVIEERQLSIPLAALAKREEELFVPGRSESIRLPHTSSALFLLQRIRDEAHRFTLGYHRVLRKKQMTKSILEEIPGVGDVTRRKLLRAFGSLTGIKKASREELLNALTSRERAETIYYFFHPPRR